MISRKLLCHWSDTLLVSCENVCISLIHSNIESKVDPLHSLSLSSTAALDRNVWLGGRYWLNIRAHSTRVRFIASMLLACNAKSTHDTLIFGRSSSSEQAIRFYRLHKHGLRVGKERTRVIHTQLLSRRSLVHSPVVIEHLSKHAWMSIEEVFVENRIIIRERFGETR